MEFGRPCRLDERGGFLHGLETRVAFFLELGTLHTYGLGDDVVIDDLQGFSNIKNENMVSIQSETRLAPYLCREHKHLENMPDT